ncbi:MAG TPA: hypothetical protein VJA94_14325 [Candidatus Angelobacter sp.]
MRPFQFVLIGTALILPLFFSGCGGSSSSSQTPTTSGLKKRVLLSNEQIGVVNIMDAQKDVLSTFTISIASPSKMVTAGGFTAVISANANSYSAIDNTKEASAAVAPTSDRVVDVTMSKDGKTAYGAVRNQGLVYAMSTADGTLSTVSVPTVTRLVLSPNSTKLLAFVDDPNALNAPNTGGFFVIDAASKSVTAITGPQLDQPFTAVFGSSETQAFVLNCGAECSGTAASVVSVDFSGTTPVFGTSVPVSGATVGLLNGANLFVAGTPAGSASGTLQVINTNTMTASAPVAITDGKHLKMQLASNNRLYIGASACTPVNDAATGLVRGCLTIFNTASSGAAVFPEFTSLRQSFNVTGIQPISNRNVVYVCEGGELDIYDTTTDKFATTQIDIVGQAVDVVQIDP